MKQCKQYPLYFVLTTVEHHSDLHLGLLVSTIPSVLHFPQWVAFCPGFPKDGRVSSHVMHLGLLVSTIPSVLHFLQWVAFCPGFPKDGCVSLHVMHFGFLVSTIPSDRIHFRVISSVIFTNFLLFFRKMFMGSNSPPSLMAMTLSFCGSDPGCAPASFQTPHLLLKL